MIIKALAICLSSRLGGTFVSLTAAGFLAGISAASPLQTAKVTKVVSDVKISERSAKARAVTEGDTMRGSSTLLTGRQSRAELRFPDSTVARIGANSVFRFNSGGRDMAIQKGSFLLQVPKNGGGATIRTATVTAAITGTTTMMEYSPGQWVKFVVLEGVAKLRNKQGDSIEVPPGQMIVMRPDAARFPKPLVLNVDKLVRTSRLLDRRVFGDLRRPALARIDRTVAGQLHQRRGGILLPSRMIVGGGPELRASEEPRRRRGIRTIFAKLPPPDGVTMPPGGGGNMIPVPSP